MDLHRYQEALACFRKAMEFQPSFSSSYFNCANALPPLHDLDRANTHYDKAIKLDPARGEYVHNQGMVYQEQGRKAEPLERFREAGKRAPRATPLQSSSAKSRCRTESIEAHSDYSLACPVHKRHPP